MQFTSNEYSGIDADHCFYFYIRKHRCKMFIVFVFCWNHACSAAVPIFPVGSSEKKEVDEKSRTVAKTSSTFSFVSDYFQSRTNSIGNFSFRGKDSRCQRSNQAYNPFQVNGEILVPNSLEGMTLKCIGRNTTTTAQKTVKTMTMNTATISAFNSKQLLSLFFEKVEA
eukprot:scaffold2868_cov113-Skeletonema_menzelii.AAC.5